MFTVCRVNVCGSFLHVSFVLIGMYWIPRWRMVRRPVVIMGAACTSALFGLIVCNRMLPSKLPHCAAMCTTAKSSSYAILHKHASNIQVQHSLVKHFDVNFLGSNSPIEDRFVAGTSQALNSALFSIIDGHKGLRCSSHLQKHLLRYVSSSLSSSAQLTGRDDLRILLDMDGTSQPQPDDSNEKQTVTLSDNTVEQCLNKAFISLDNDISNAGLDDIKMVLKGHSFTEEMKQRVMTTIEGACAILAMVQPQSISVASTGDCRVVLGQKLANNTWKAIPLSNDQNAHNQDEVERLKQAHPGEEETVIASGRVLGSLMPFRTFGDSDFKWEKKYLERIVMTWPNYLTPPYITAEPVVTHHRVEKSDRFLILASDGLWERMTDEEAVAVVRNMKEPRER